MHTIEVKNLSKFFRAYQKEPGIVGAMKSFIKRDYYDVKAVHNVSFEIKEGELVGFIGPNGAGKTTTLKCLSGLLHPSKGQVSVLGYTPFDRKHEFLRQISLVMGQKNQLWWDLPAMESFLLNKEIYQIPERQFKTTLSDLTDLLDVSKIVNVQVRKLSLGQRMKCELIASLLHSPKVIFLDEPTIGLDVVMQQNLREFVREYNKNYKATILLTSHYMEDVKELCKRVIIIDQGRILYDGKLQQIIRKFAKYKLLSVTFHKPVQKAQLMDLGKVVLYEEFHAVISTPFQKAKHVAARLLDKFPVDDLNIQEPDIGKIIREVFASKKA